MPPFIIKCARPPDLSVRFTIRKRLGCAKRENRVHMAKEQDWRRRRKAEGYAGRRKARKDIIPHLLVGDDLDLRAKPARFLHDHCTHAVDRGFIVRRRFRFNEASEKGFSVHTGIL